MSLSPSDRILGTTLVVSVGLPAELCVRLEQAVNAHFRKGSFLKSESYITATRRPTFLTSIKTIESSIIFIDFDRSTEQAVESAQYLSQEFQGRVSVVAIGLSRDPGLILSAMRAGCCEFLTLPLQTAALLELFERLDKKKNLTQSRQAQGGSIISFFGAKGGVGVTTIATHFAVYLAQHYRKRTLLIDGRPELGHVAIYLGINSDRFHFQNVMRDIGRMDSELLQGFLAEHSSGLRVLTSPDTGGDAARSNERTIAETLEFLRGEFDYIVIDGSMPHQRRGISFVSASDRLQIVLTPEVSAIRDLSRHLDRFGSGVPSADKLQLILNRVSRTDVIRPEEIEESTKLPIALRVPSMGREFVRACNLGEPLHLDPKVPFTTSLSEYVAEVAGITPVVSGDAEHRGLMQFKRTSNHALLWRKGFAYK